MQEGAVIRFKESYNPPLAKQARYGQLQRLKNPGSLEVNFLERHADGVHLHLGSLADLVTVSAQHVAQHANIDNFDRLQAHYDAWNAVGLRLVDVSDTKADTFVRLDAPADALVMNGNVDDLLARVHSDSDSDSDTDEPEGTVRLSGYFSDDGFVVPDTEPCAEPFTLGDPDESSFVADTHDAVHAYEGWMPTTQAGKKFRQWIEAFEAKIAHRTDDAHFQRGSAAPNAARPPLKKRRTTSGS